MKKKSLITLIITAIFTLVILTPAAHAGNVQRNRWEGLAIGLGTAIIGSALLNQHRSYEQQPQVTYNSPPEQRYTPSRPEYEPRWDNPTGKHYGPKHHKGDSRRGHWEIRKEWVPPTYKKVWNPGHYTRGGDWKSGDWIRIEDKPGYWTQTRVWVARR